MPNLSSQTILVTGATSGIGYETALALASMGARVILAGRDPTRTADAIQKIRAHAAANRVEGVIADLSTHAGVKQLAQEVLNLTNQLDVLVNNAGAYFSSRTLTTGGIEMTLALNHLSYFQLTNLLLGALKNAPSARIVNVASAAHAGAHIHFDDLQFEQQYNGWTAYGQSKLANILFTYELSRRLEGSTITINALHPGFVATRFGHNNKNITGVAIRVGQVGALTPRQGAETVIYLAASAEVALATGQYFSNRKAIRSSMESYDESIARRLWIISEALSS